MDNLQSGDSGTYVLEISAPDCPVVVSPPIILEVVCATLPVVPAAPAGAQAFMVPFNGGTGYPIEIEWESVALNASDFSVDGVAFGDQVWSASWTGQGDHPPGNYEIEYLTGFLYLDAAGSAAFGCGVGETASFVWIHGLRDVNNPLTFPDPFDNKDVALDMGNAGTCSVGVAGVQASFWDGFIGTRASLNRLHSDLGGDFFAWNYDNAGTWPFANLVNDPAHALQFKVWQVSGLVQKTRQLSVDDWAEKLTHFPASVADWNGILDLRTSYSPGSLVSGSGIPSLGRFRMETSFAAGAWTLKVFDGLTLDWQGDKAGGSDASGTYLRTGGTSFDPTRQYAVPTLEWGVVPVGSFGGAVCFYTQAHPTAPNGCGWTLEIYDTDLSLLWRGHKVIGSSGDGTYGQSEDSPTDAVCSLTLVDFP
jgi:hypothetical protein